MPFWVDDTGILMDDTGVIECGTCPCTGEVLCAGCTSTLADEYVVENPGVTNLGCTGSAAVNLLANRTISSSDPRNHAGTLGPNATCVFSGPLFNACGNEEAYWWMYYDTANELWELGVADVTISYRATGTQDCTSGWTFDFDSAGSEFDNWPTTLDVTPN